MSQNVVDFYISQVNSDNHQVREAACFALTEIFTRIAPEFNREAFRGSALRISEELLARVKDQYWGVRVQACLSLFHITKVYQVELGGIIETLVDTWIQRLSDNVCSVRESAAIALVGVCSQLKLEERIKEYLQVNLMKAKEQKPESS